METERYLVLKLRVAVREDFTDQFEQKKLGTLYFQKSITGIIETKPRFFTNEICMKTFRELYAAKQIFVPVFERSEIKEVEEDQEEVINKQL